MREILAATAIVATCIALQSQETKIPSLISWEADRIDCILDLARFNVLNLTDQQLTAIEALSQDFQSNRKGDLLENTDAPDNAGVLGPRNLDALKDDGTKALSERLAQILSQEQNSISKKIYFEEKFKRDPVGAILAPTVAERISLDPIQREKLQQILKKYQKALKEVAVGTLSQTGFNHNSKVSNLHEESSFFVGQLRAQSLLRDETRRLAVDLLSKKQKETLLEIGMDLNRYSESPVQLTLQWFKGEPLEYRVKFRSKTKQSLSGRSDSMEYEFDLKRTISKLEPNQGVEAIYKVIGDFKVSKWLEDMEFSKTYSTNGAVTGFSPNSKWLESLGKKYPNMNEEAIDNMIMSTPTMDLEVPREAVKVGDTWKSTKTRSEGVEQLTYTYVGRELIDGKIIKVITFQGRLVDTPEKKHMKIINFTTSGTFWLDNQFGKVVKLESDEKYSVESGGGLSFDIQSTHVATLKMPL